ncbi:MAG: peptidase C39 family protein [Candidatus Bathyarchaeia archaeon]
MTKRSLTDEVVLDIPFHHQRHDFTCGPACLMMAMKYFDPSLEMSEDLEIDIWRETNLVEDWSTCGRGLAYSAAKRGYGAKIIASVDDIPFKDKILSISPNADPKVLEFFFRDMKRRALAMEVPEINRSVTFEDMAVAIRRNSVPILLINAKFLHDEDVPHWVVVRGWNRQGVLINDPMWTFPKAEPIPYDMFTRMVGYGSGQVLIVVFRKS